MGAAGWNPKTIEGNFVKSSDVNKPSGFGRKEGYFHGWFLMFLYFVVILVPCQSDICLKTCHQIARGWHAGFSEGSRHRCRRFNLWCSGELGTPCYGSWWFWHRNPLTTLVTLLDYFLCKHRVTNHKITLLVRDCASAAAANKNKERRVLRVHSQVIFPSYHVLLA